MTSYFCQSCKLVNGDYCGSWDDMDEYFPKIKQAHLNCIGFQKGEPILKGKANWGHTEIEKEATSAFNQNIDRWLHELIAELKGTNKTCLYKDKLKMESQV